MQDDFQRAENVRSESSQGENASRSTWTRSTQNLTYLLTALLHNLGRKRTSILRPKK